MYHDVPYRSVTARGTNAVVLRSSVRSVASTMAWIFRAATPTPCAPSWALKSSEAPWNWKKWNFIEMFSDIVAIHTKPSHYASQMEVSGFIEFCFLSTSCTVSASLVSVQKRMCVSLFEADWQYEYRITKQDFPICFGKDFSSYRQNSCCCDTADIPRHPSNVRYIAFITLDIWWFWCMIGSQWFVKMLQVYGPTRSMKVIESVPLSEKSRLSLHVLSGFAASSQSCPKWLATAFWRSRDRSRELRGFTTAESYREP